MIIPAPMHPIRRLRVRTGASGSKRSTASLSSTRDASLFAAPLSGVDTMQIDAAF